MYSLNAINSWPSSAFDCCCRCCCCCMDIRKIPL